MRVALAAFLLLLASCATVSNQEADVRARSSALARAAGNVEESVAFFTTTAVVHVDGAPALRGPAEIAELFRLFFANRVSSYSETREVRVAGSGELAYEIGVAHLIARETELQKLGIKQSANKYLAIWTRGKDGVWRIDALSITSDPR